MAFRGTEKIKRVFGSKGDSERAGIGEADVFTGHAHHAPREIERIFSGFEHAREPVESSVWIGIADRFVQGGDEVVMLLAGFVVAEEFPLKNVFEEFRSDGAHAPFTGMRAADGEFYRVVGGAGVAIRERRDAEEDVVRSFCSFVAQAVFFVPEGAAEKFDDLRRG